MQNSHSIVQCGNDDTTRAAPRHILLLPSPFPVPFVHTQLFFWCPLLSPSILSLYLSLSLSLSLTPPALTLIHSLFNQNSLVRYT